MSSHTHTANSSERSERSGASWGVGQIILWQLIFAVGFFFGIQYGDLVRLF
ncbi:hypothetical protein ACN08N_26470 (plasmid) [Photobacterium leiognathi subsp. mandapamensis]|uniref:hypothetical protein n=1 Tax=Photobacterium leiognathi TaxID=553611 RepID=UPI003AF3C1AA